MNMESPESPPPTSFSSLPNDVALNIFARISRIRYPTLSLVSKSFRAILSCRDLYVTRTLISKTEDFLYVYLNLNHKNPDLRWFALSLVPNRQKLIPMPSFPYAKDSTVLSTGSEIYIIGGFSKEGERSKRVFVMDTRSHQWRRLPDMNFARRYPAADVIDGKLYVFDVTGKIWGEVYDPKTQTWTRFIENTIDLTFQKSMLRGKQVYLGSRSCFIEVENEMYEICIEYGKLACRSSFRVLGLEELSSNKLVSVANPSGGSRVTVWWKTVMVHRRRGHYTKENGSDRGHSYSRCKTNIWSAEISFERRGKHELWGLVEWSKCLVYFNGWADSNFFLDSATIMPH